MIAHEYSSTTGRKIESNQNWNFFFQYRIKIDHLARILHRHSIISSATGEHDAEMMQRQTTVNYALQIPQYHHHHQERQLEYAVKSYTANNQTSIVSSVA